MWDKRHKKIEGVSSFQHHVKLLVFVVFAVCRQLFWTFCSTEVDTERSGLRFSFVCILSRVMSLSYFSTTYFPFYLSSINCCWCSFLFISTAFGKSSWRQVSDSFFLFLIFRDEGRYWLFIFCTFSQVYIVDVIIADVYVYF